MRVESAEARAFYEIETIQSNWSTRELEQMQLYVNYYDQELRTEGDNPTLGLILCTDKNDAVVKYTLGPEQSKEIFASRYKFHLPSEAELRHELRRKVRQLTSPKPSHKPRQKKSH
jgi:hypothetical protein